MRKIHKIVNIVLIFTLIGVLVCIKPAFGLRPPSLLNKAGREAIIKTILKEANDFTGYDNLKKTFQTLSQYGYSGILTDSNIVRHKASNTSVMLIGGTRVGKAAVPKDLIRGIEGKLYPGQWELVAHIQLVFLFLDNKPEQLFIIQGPTVGKNRCLRWVNVARDDKGELTEIRRWVEEPDIIPINEPVKLSAIVWYLKELSRKDVEIELSMPNTELREMAVKSIVDKLEPRGSSSDLDIKEVLNNTDSIPFIAVRRPDGLMTEVEFQEMVMKISDLLQTEVLPRSDNEAVFADGMTEEDIGLLNLKDRIEITGLDIFSNDVIEFIEKHTNRKFRPIFLKRGLSGEVERNPLRWCLSKLCNSASRRSAGAISTKMYLYEQKDSSWILEFTVSQERTRKGHHWEKIVKTARRFQEAEQIEQGLGIEYLIDMNQRIKDGLASKGKGLYYIGVLMKETPVRVIYERTGPDLKGLKTSMVIKLNPLFETSDTVDELMQIQEDIELINLLFSQTAYKFNAEVERRFVREVGSFAKYHFQDLQLTSWGDNIATLLHSIVTASILRSLQEGFPDRKFEGYIHENAVDYTDLSFDFKGSRVTIFCDKIDGEVKESLRSLSYLWEEYLKENCPYNAIYKDLEANKDAIEGKFLLKSSPHEGRHKQAIETICKVLAEWALHDANSRGYIRKYLENLKETFSIPPSKVNLILEPQKELPRTNPLDFKPDNFLFLVKPAGLTGKLEDHEVAFLTCITPEEDATMQDWGWILDVPDENIVHRSLRDFSGRGVDKRGKNLPLTLWRGRHKKYYSNLKDLLNDNPPDSGTSNQVIVTMEGVEKIGLFYRPSFDPEKIDEEQTNSWFLKLKERLLEEGKKEGIPVIELSPSSTVYTPPQFYSFRYSFADMDSDPQIFLDRALLALNDAEEKGYGFFGDWLLFFMAGYGGPLDETLRLITQNIFQYNNLEKDGTIYGRTFYEERHLVIQVIGGGQSKLDEKIDGRIFWVSEGVPEELISKGEEMFDEISLRSIFAALDTLRRKKLIAYDQDTSIRWFHDESIKVPEYSGHPNPPVVFEMRFPLVGRHGEKPLKNISRYLAIKSRRKPQQDNEAIFEHGMTMEDVDDLALKDPIKIIKPELFHEIVKQADIQGIARPIALREDIIELIERYTGRVFRSTSLQLCLGELYNNAFEYSTGGVSSKVYLHESQNDNKKSSWTLEVIILQKGVKKLKSWDKERLGGWEIIRETAKRFQKLEREEGIEYLIDMNQRIKDGLASPGGGMGFHNVGKLMESEAPVFLKFKEIKQKKRLETHLCIELDLLFEESDVRERLRDIQAGT